MDEYGGSYRYHTLLRDFLRRELAAREPERVPGLHRRAATWYAANGDLDLAVDHAFAAGDLDLAAALVGRGMLGYHWSGRRATMRAWFATVQRRCARGAPLARRPGGLGGARQRATSRSTMRLADIAERGTFAGRPPDGTASFESGRAMLRATMVRAGRR